MIQSSKIMIVMGLSRVQKKLRIFNPQQNWIFAIKYHHRTRLWSIFGLPGLSGGFKGGLWKSNLPFDMEIHLPFSIKKHFRN